MLKIGILGSGSKGNSIVISCKDESLLIDAGFSRKELLRRLDVLGVDPGTIRCVLLTHEHSDHICGAPLFCDTLRIPLCAAGSVLANQKRKKAKLPERLWSFEPGEQFAVGSFRVSSFSVQHDAVDPVGFSISCSDARIGIATDLGEVSPMVRRNLANSDVLILESNYDAEMLRNSNRREALKNRINGRHGHLDNRAAAAALQTLLGERSKLLLLAHRSSECNTEELVTKEISAELDRMSMSGLPFAVLAQERCIMAKRLLEGNFCLEEIAENG